MKYRMYIMATIMSFAVATARADAGRDTPTAPAAKGYNCLFMGHSFFAPIAIKFAALPSRCGFRNHKQTVVFHGGVDGSPGMLWKSTSADMTAARKLIETGNVDLLGLTFFDAGSNISDYRRWVDLALRFNPNTRFVIQAPWPRFNNRSLTEYESTEELCLTAVHQLIDELRKAYPQTTFVCIPQGRWMVGLWHRYTKGELPEVAGVFDPQHRSPCLFNDPLGHGGNIPVEMGALLWLAVIYQVDLNQCEYPPAKSDLKKMAQEICRNDPYCGLNSKSFRQ